MDLKMFVTLIHVRNKIKENPKCFFVDIYYVMNWINYGRDRRSIFKRNCDHDHWA